MGEGLKVDKARDTSRTSPPGDVSAHYSSDKGQTRRWPS